MPPVTHSVTASVSGGHGTVSPANQTVNQGATATINISPDAGYHTASIVDNGQAVSIADPCLIPNVQGNHTVVVTFEEDEGKGPPEPPNPPEPDKTTLYLAEGYTGANFYEYICLGNPGEEEAKATITYLFPDGGDQIQEINIPASSRSTINVNEVVGAGREVSAKIESENPILAERPMYFNYQNKWSGGHDAVAATSTSYELYFAEGYTGQGFDEYICVLNPGSIQASLIFFFQTQEAGERKIEGLSIPANSRKTFKINDILGPNYQASAKLISDQAVVAERATYFSYKDKWTGGHCVMGAPALSDSYYFAEGTTRSGFEQWLTIQNPDSENPVTVRASYQFGPGQGAGIEKDYPVGAGKRETLYIPEQAGAGKDVSIKLTSEEPFLAERPVYFRYTYKGVDWNGGHCVIGATSPAKEWFFAEGYTAAGFHEWICAQNPGEEEAQVEISYYTSSGPLDKKYLAIPAGSRATIMVNDHAGANLELSCRLMVTSGPGIVAERPMYFTYRGLDGGHDVVGMGAIP